MFNFATESKLHLDEMYSIYHVKSVFINFTY